MKFKILFISLISLLLVNCNCEDGDNVETEHIEQENVNSAIVEGYFLYNVSEYGGRTDQFADHSNNITIYNDQLVINIKTEDQVVFQFVLKGKDVEDNPIQSYTPSNDLMNSGSYRCLINASGFYADDTSNPYTLKVGELMITAFDLKKGFVEANFHHEGGKTDDDNSTTHLPFKGELSLSGLQVIDSRNQ